MILTDTMDERELFKILKCPGVKGLSGQYVSRTDMDLSTFKEKVHGTGYQDDFL